MFAVNRNLEEDCRLELDLRSFEKCVPVEKLELAGFGLKEENTASEERVRPQSLTDIRMENWKSRDRTEKSFLECTSLSFIKHLLKTMVFIGIMKYQS